MDPLTKIMHEDAEATRAKTLGAMTEVLKSANEIATALPQATARQAIAAAQVYLRYLAGHGLMPALEPEEWVSAKVRYNNLLSVVEVQFAGMVLAIEQDGHTHS